MSDNDNIIQTIEWKDTGTEEVIRGSEAVRQSVLDATQGINDANDALGDLNTQIGNMPSLTLPPPMPIPFDTEEVKDAARQIDKVGESAVDAGKASEMLYSALDSVIPGLGGVAESLFSLNPVAVAGTAAIAVLTLAFKAQADQAEITRKAIEASVKAESERAYADKDIEQKLNLALAGDVEARKRLILEYVDAAANQAKVDAEYANLRKQHVEALADYNLKVEEERKRAVDGGGAFIESLALANTKEKQALDATAKALDDYGSTLQTSLSQTEALDDAARKLGITQEELAAVNLAVAQGAEGATAALEKVWTAGEQLAQLGGTVDKVFDVFKTIGQDALKFADEQAKQAKQVADDRAEAEARLLQVNEQLADVEMDRGKVLADRFIEEQRAAEFAKLNTQLEAAIAEDAARAKNAKVAEIMQEGHAAEIAAQQKFMADQQKLLANYLKAEQEATKDYSLERVRKLEDLYNTLNDLASQRDVAGFVNARRAGMTDIGRSDQDFGIEAQRRKASYEQAAADQQAAYQKETATRQTQLQQKLQQEQQAGQQEVSMADRVRKQIADLQARYAAQDLQARRMQEDASYRQTVSILQAKRDAELKITSGAAAGVLAIVSNMRDAILRVGSSVMQGAARGGNASNLGTPSMTRGGLAAVDPADNARFMRSGGGQSSAPNLTIENLNVGKVATQADIDTAIGTVVNGIRRFASNGS